MDDNLFSIIYIHLYITHSLFTFYANLGLWKGHVSEISHKLYLMLIQGIMVMGAGRMLDRGCDGSTLLLLCPVFYSACFKHRVYCAYCTVLYVNSACIMASQSLANDKCEPMYSYMQEASKPWDNLKCCHFAIKMTKWLPYNI